jgi:hypothetical protein
LLLKTWQIDLLHIGQHIAEMDSAKQQLVQRTHGNAIQSTGYGVWREQASKALAEDLSLRS